MKRIIDIEGGVHTGTHLDAPCHFIADGIGVGRLALDVLIGSARIAHFPGADAIDAVRSAVSPIAQRSYHSSLKFNPR